MNPVDVIRSIRAHGGEVSLEDGTLRLTAPAPLPDDLRVAAKEHKAGIMIALGAPIDTVVNRIISDIRPYLPRVLQRLSDEKILALVNWSLISAWHRAVESAADRAQ